MDMTDRPTAREVADLLRDLDAMIADAGGWACRVDPDRLVAWQARKAALLARWGTDGHDRHRQEGGGT